MTILAWNCRGMGSAPAVRALTDEVKGCDPMLVFLAETKANRNRIKGLQRVGANSGNNGVSRWSEWKVGAAVEGGLRCALQELLKLAY